MPKILEEASLICDDVRLEQGQKVSLMGVYGSTINIKSKEGLLPRLCLFKRLSVEPPMRIDAELDLIDPDGKSVLGEGPKPRMDAIEIGKDTTLALGLGPVRLPKGGSYSFLLSLRGKGEEPLVLRTTFGVQLEES